MKKKELTYEKAVARIEEIVRIVDDKNTGIERLSELLKEAQELIAYCKAQLLAVENEINIALSKEEK